MSAAMQVNLKKVLLPDILLFGFHRTRDDNCNCWQPLYQIHCPVIGQGIRATMKELDAVSQMTTLCSCQVISGETYKT